MGKNKKGETSRQNRKKELLQVEDIIITIPKEGYINQNETPKVCRQLRTMKIRWTPPCTCYLSVYVQVCYPRSGAGGRFLPDFFFSISFHRNGGLSGGCHNRRCRVGGGRRAATYRFCGCRGSPSTILLGGLRRGGG